MGSFIDSLIENLDKIAKTQGWSQAQEDYALAPLRMAAADAGFSYITDPIDSTISIISGLPEGHAQQVFFQSAYDRSVGLRPSPVPPGWDSWLLMLASHIDQAILEQDRAWLNSIPGLVLGTAETSAHDLREIGVKTESAIKKAGDIASGSTSTLIVGGLAVFGLIWATRGRS